MELRSLRKEGAKNLSLLGLKNSLDELARASTLRWFGHVLRRALDFEVARRRGHGRPNMMWKRQVEEQINQIELKREDAIDRVKWCNGVYELLRRSRWIRPPPLTQTKPDLSYYCGCFGDHQEIDIFHA